MIVGASWLQSNERVVSILSRYMHRSRQGYSHSTILWSLAASTQRLMYPVKHNQVKGRRSPLQKARNCCPSSFSGLSLILQYLSTAPVWSTSHSRASKTPASLNLADLLRTLILDNTKGLLTVNQGLLHDVEAYKRILGWLLLQGILY